MIYRHVSVHREERRVSLIPKSLLGVGYRWSNVPSRGQGIPGGGLRVYPQIPYSPGTTKSGGTHPTGTLSCLYFFSTRK